MVSLSLLPLLQMSVNFLVSLLKKNWQNVRSLHCKTTMVSLGLPCRDRMPMQCCHFARYRHQPVSCGSAHVLTALEWGGHAKSATPAWYISLKCTCGVMWWQAG